MSVHTTIAIRLWAVLRRIFGDGSVDIAQGASSDTGVTAVQKDVQQIGVGEDSDSESCTFLFLVTDVSFVPGPGATVTKGGKIWKAGPDSTVRVLGQNAIYALDVSRRKARDLA